MDFKERFRGRTNFVTKSGVIDHSKEQVNSSRGAPGIVSASTSNATTQLQFNSRKQAPLGRIPPINIQSQQNVNAFSFGNGGQGMPLISASNQRPDLPPGNGLPLVATFGNAQQHERISRVQSQAILHTDGNKQGPQGSSRDHLRRQGLQQPDGFRLVDSSAAKNATTRTERKHVLNMNHRQQQITPQQFPQLSQKGISKSQGKLDIQRQKSHNRIIQLQDSSFAFSQEASEQNTAQNGPQERNEVRSIFQSNRNSLEELKATQNESAPIIYDNPQEAMDGPLQVQQARTNLREHLTQRLRVNLNALRNSEPLKGSNKKLKPTQESEKILVVPSLRIEDQADDVFSRYRLGVSRQQAAGRQPGKLQARSYNKQSSRYQQQPRENDYGQDTFNSPQINNLSQESYGLRTADRSIESQDKARFNDSKQTYNTLKRSPSQLSSLGGSSLQPRGELTGTSLISNLIKQRNADPIMIDEQSSQTEKVTLQRNESNSNLKLLPCIVVSPKESGFKLLDPKKQSSEQNILKTRKISFNKRQKIKQLLQLKDQSRQVLPQLNSAYQDQTPLPTGRLDLLTAETAQRDRSVPALPIARDSSNQELKSLTRNGLAQIESLEKIDSRSQLRYPQIMKKSDDALSSARSIAGVSSMAIKKSYHEAFSQQQQHVILQSILKHQVHQVERPKPPQSGRQAQQ